MSILIHIHSTDRMSIVDLWRLIFKFTFDKRGCGHTTKKTIEENLLKWNDVVQMLKKKQADQFGIDSNYTPVGKKGSILDEMEYQIGNMCSWVVREEKDEFQHLVETYARNKIDYRLAQPMCKVFTKECEYLRNPARGRAALKANMEEFPEIYENLKNIRMEGI